MTKCCLVAFGDLFDIFIQPTAWGQTGWIWKNDEFRQWMDERITTTQILLSQQKIRPDISLQITIPNCNSHLPVAIYWFQITTSNYDSRLQIQIVLYTS